MILGNLYRQFLSCSIVVPLLGYTNINYLEHEISFYLTRTDSDSEQCRCQCQSHFFLLNIPVKCTRVCACKLLPWHNCQNGLKW